MIRQNLENILAHIPASVTVVGVTKYSDVPAMNEAIASGLRHIAENRVPSAAEKFPRLDLGGQAVCKHLIGHLQSNKARDAVGLFDLIQSVDSMKLASEIEKRAAAINKVQDILVQVDVAQEEQKFGVAEEDLDGLLTHLEGCAHIRTLGLMCMAPLTEDKALIHGVFRRLKEHFERIKRARAASARVIMQHLSMGMSGDYQIAIEEGSTMVRIGSAIFK